MRSFLLICLVLVGIGKSYSQKFSATDTTNFDSIRNLEYRLEGLSNNIINGEDQLTRITSTYYFIQNFKEVLKIKNSYNYPFNKLQTISILKPEDNKFRIYTWNLLLDSGKYMYFGVIQMNLKDSFQIFGLYDSSSTLKNPTYAILDNRHWMGALYYQIQEYKHNKKTYYLLMGWDGENALLNRKLIDILWFDENGQPKFGSPVFDNGGDIQSRMIFTFAEDATILLRYEKEEKIIIFANTVPPNPNMKGQFQYYLPDGTYDFMRYKKGFWVRYEYLFKDAKDPQLYRKE